MSHFPTKVRGAKSRFHNASVFLDTELSTDRDTLGILAIDDEPDDDDELDEDEDEDEDDDELTIIVCADDDDELDEDDDDDELTIIVCVDDEDS